jgi:predicted secreted protein
MEPNMRLLHRFFLFAAISLPAMNAFAADPPSPENVVSFMASSTIEVTKDLLAVSLQVTREGPDAAGVQAALKQVLDAALAEAKKTAQSGALDVRTGQFSIYPRYGRDNRISGWQGTAEIVLEGRDNARVAQAAGRIKDMNITGTGYAISRDLREKHESDVTAQAIAKYRARAGEIAKQFGFAGYALREVNVSAQDMGGPQPVPMMTSRARAMDAAETALPTEPGKGTITATVQGSIQLTR